jgi:hypothetical protein
MNMAKGWKLEPGRHALAAKGVPTGHLALHVPFDVRVGSRKYVIREKSESPTTTEWLNPFYRAKGLTDIDTAAFKAIMGKVKKSIPSYMDEATIREIKDTHLPNWIHVTISFDSSTRPDVPYNEIRAYYNTKTGEVRGLDKFIAGKG